MQKSKKQSELHVGNRPAKLNVLETGIHLATAEIDVGFVTTATLIEAFKEKKLSQLQIYEFKKECCAFLAIIVTKIQ